MTALSSFLVDDADISGLQNCLVHIAKTGYSEIAVCERLGLKDINDFQMRSVPMYRKECLSIQSHLDTVIDIFLLQGIVKAKDLAQFLDKEDFDVLTRTGIIKIDEAGMVQATVSLYPVGNHLFFSDHSWPQLYNSDCSIAPFNQVMFVGTDSRWLARATMRRPVSQALDLCTGSGIQALLAASHAKRVVAVDINERAIRCTRFNVSACGCRNIEVRIGDLYEPVDKEQFDLITANPPFVPSPVNSLGFRDGGHSGEDIQSRIVAGIPDHLAPGGIAQIVTEIGERNGESIVDRVRLWLGNAPMDIHLIRLRIFPAAVYSIGHAQGETPSAFLESVGAWADNLREQGFTNIIAVLIALQWSDPSCGDPWNRVDEAYPPVRDAGVEIEAAFAAEHFIRNPDLQKIIEKGKLVRTGALLLHEDRILGSNTQSKCSVILSGNSMPMEYQLDSIERDLLDTMDTPVDMPLLLKVASRINVGESVLYGAIKSLLRKRLISLIN